MTAGVGMRVKIRLADYEMEYDGPAAVWDDVLQPHFGGPAAGDGEADDSGPTPTDADAHGDDDTAQAWAALADSEGRRAEKDAVLLAVWELGGDRRDVRFDAVARHVHAHEAFHDVRVKPILLKHMSRSHMLDPGTQRETVRLTAKGRSYLSELSG